MHRIRRSTAIVALVLACAAAPQLRAQWTVTAGVKGWMPAWDLKIDRDPGAEQSDFSSAFLLGPSLTVRYRMVSLAASYTATLRHFEATATNPGTYVFGYNGTRMVSRRDINLLLNIHFSAEFAVFGTVKLLRYEVRDALTYINTMQSRSLQSADGSALGAGVNVGFPFSGRSPFYAFMSGGVLAGTLTTEDPQWSLFYNGQTLQWTTEGGESGSEIIYFLDAGLGLRVPASNLGATAGVRVERGKDSRTIVGPTLSVYYSLLTP